MEDKFTKNEPLFDATGEQKEKKRKLLEGRRETVTTE
jgi:hypothetical protein